MSGPQVLEVSVTTNHSPTTLETGSPSLLTDMHFVPCSIAYSGEADLDRWFNVEAPVDYYDQLDEKGQLRLKPLPHEKYVPRKAIFRGHQLSGHIHPLPEGTIGVIIENVPNDNGDSHKATSSTTLASISQLPAPKDNQTTTTTSRFPSRSKQDALFDSDDDDFDHGRVASQHMSSQIRFSVSSSTTSLAREENPNEGQLEPERPANVKKLRVTGAFKEIHLWDPHFPEDSSLFSFRQQPIDELIPLAQALHLSGYDEDE